MSESEAKRLKDKELQEVMLNATKEVLKAIEHLASDDKLCVLKMTKTILFFD